MAEHPFASRDFLRIFDVVTNQGNKAQGTCELNGIKAWHDFDGYTCWLGYKDLTVTLMFHGQLMVDYDSDESLREFYDKSQQLTSR